jgi:anti-anti-sigma factor
LILDFATCPFCDHAGLGVVLSIKTTLDKRKGRVCLIGLNQMLDDALSLLGLRQMLPVAPDESAAVRRLLER